jgi:hypothetical protein
MIGELIFFWVLRQRYQNLDRLIKDIKIDRNITQISFLGILNIIDITKIVIRLDSQQPDVYFGYHMKSMNRFVWFIIVIVFLRIHIHLVN